MKRPRSAHLKLPSAVDVAEGGGGGRVDVAVPYVGDLHLEEEEEEEGEHEHVHEQQEMRLLSSQSCQTNV